MTKSFRCALCGESISKNVYYCAKHQWHLCWDCLLKGVFTTARKCPKCSEEVTRVD